MKTYFSDIIPKILRFSKKLDNLALLMNQKWILVDENQQNRTVYIFCSDTELIISQNGKVEKAHWKYITTNNILIESEEGSFLFSHAFFDEDILALKLDNSQEYLLLVNETKNVKELSNGGNVIGFLQKKYLNISSGAKGLNVAPLMLDNKYNAPSYKKSVDYVGRTSGILITKELVTYFIQFEDGIEGLIYVEDKSNMAYYVPNYGTPNGGFNIYYNTIEDCINALHYFKKTKQKLDYGYFTMVKR